MASRASVPIEEKISDVGRPPDVEHQAWARAKIERALAESVDREAMIAAEDVWRDLGLES